MMQRDTVGGTFGVIVAALFLSSIVLGVPKAYSEAYIGGQIGTALPGFSLIPGNTLTNAELTDLSPPGSTLSPSGSISDRELSRSILGGVKLGYYFAQAPWIGVETEFFYTTPHIKQQNTRITIQPGTILNGAGPIVGGTSQNVLTGDHFRVMTWAPVNLMFRYNKTRLQPYIGVGPGIFFARVHTTVTGFEGTQNSTSIGLNAKAGIEFYITRHLTAFAEWKYNRASFSFDANNNGAFGFDADYHIHFGTAGLSYHF